MKLNQKYYEFIDSFTKQKLIIINDSYVESELEIIKEFNKNKSGKTTEIHLDAMFELGVSGDIENALLLVLNSNCGYTPADSDAFNNLQIREAFASIREDVDHPHFALSTYTRNIKQGNGKMYPMCVWWERHIGKRNGLLKNVRDWLNIDKKKKKKDAIDEAIHWLSYHLATREFYCYHSKNADIQSWSDVCKDNIGKKLSPHQEIMIEEIKWAINNDIPIFISRAVDDWLEFGKKHIKINFANYKYLFIGGFPRCACITPGNVQQGGNNAWDKFIGALKNRFDKIRKEESHIGTTR